MENEKASEEVKAACKEWLDTFNSGITNGAATDKLVAALEGVTATYAKILLRTKTSWLRNPSGYSAVTAGHTTSVSAVLTMYWLPDRIST